MRHIRKAELRCYTLWSLRKWLIDKMVLSALSLHCRRNLIDLIVYRRIPASASMHQPATMKEDGSRILICNCDIFLHFTSHAKHFQQLGQCHFNSWFTCQILTRPKLKFSMLCSHYTTLLLYDLSNMSKFSCKYILQVVICTFPDISLWQIVRI